MLATSAATALSVLMARRAGAAVPTRDDLVGAIAYELTDPRRTLLDLALERDLGILELSAANPGIDVWVPGDETMITLPTAHLLPDAKREGIVINLAELRLYKFEAGGVVTHPIGVGRDGFATPVGVTSIVRKAVDPTWYPTASTRNDRPDLPQVVGPGPDNPLGNRALYLGWPTYLIHGTNKPFGVGRRVSRGCIRMYPFDVEALFERTPVGTRVEVVREPIKLGIYRGELMLEAHPDPDQLDQLEARYRLRPKLPPPGIRERIILAAGDEASRIDWRIVDAELANRSGLPVRISADRPQRPSGAATAGRPGSLRGLY